MSDLHIPRAKRYWCYIFCWLKILRFVDFLVHKSQCYSWVHDTTGGSFRLEFKRFECWNPFLEDLKKFDIFIFFMCPICYFSSQALLMLYILLTKISMFFYQSWYLSVTRMSGESACVPILSGLYLEQVLILFEN